MTNQDSLVGKRFADYQLESLLGHGGMARVYRGLNTKLKRYEAIKVIDTQFRDDSEYVRRFEMEAQAIAQLNHPHIVTVFQSGHVDDVLYMAMQYIEGSDVAAALDLYEANGEYMNPTEALKILRETGSALDYVHQRGIIHRDVKPSNIMLDAFGRAILTDFGLALMTEIGTRGEIFGTPHYLSPEQAISSAGVVPQSDIYSLGVIAYRMFTGMLPFVGGEPLDIALMHLNDDPPDPRDFRPELSEAITDVLLTSLEKTPEARYQTGAALAEALDAAIKQTEAITRRTSMPRLSIPEVVQIDMTEHPIQPPAMNAKQTPEQPSISGMIAGEAETLPHSAPPTVPSGRTTDKAAKPAARPRMTDTIASVKSQSFFQKYGMFIIGIVVLIVVVGIVALFFLNGDDPNEVLVLPTQVETPTAIPATQVLATEIIPSDSPTALVVSTSIPTEIPPTQVVVAPTSTPSANVITLELIATGEDSLIIHNQSESITFDLTFLRFTNVPSGGENLIGIGGGFSATDIAPGECVAYTKPNTEVNPDNCILIDSVVVQEGRNRVWKQDYRVLYQNGLNSEFITTCDRNSECVLAVVVGNP